MYLDYHTAMKDARDGLPATLSHDGVHPTHAGYEVMTPAGRSRNRESPEVANLSAARTRN